MRIDILGIRLSIRHKVIIAVAALYVFMAAGILGSYYFMHELEEKISYLEDISKLEESVLEIRRFEKNYFLYGDQQSLNTAQYHLNRAQDLLDKNAAKIQALSSSREVDHFKGDLQEYQQLISACLDPALAQKCLPTSDSRVEFEAKIRKTGSSISDFAQNVAQRKRESIRQTIGTTVRLQLLVFALIGIGLVAVGSFVFAKVMKPLKLLEERYP